MNQSNPDSARSGEETALRTVFIVEDAPEIYARLVTLVEHAGGAQVVGQADTPADAVSRILLSRPDCVVLDYHLRGGTGLDVLRQIRAAGCTATVIVLTNDPDPLYRRLCIAAGARWFLDKTTEFARVRDIVAGRDSA